MCANAYSSLCILQRERDAKQEKRDAWAQSYVSKLAAAAAELAVRKQAHDARLASARDHASLAAALGGMSTVQLQQRRRWAKGEEEANVLQRPALTTVAAAAAAAADEDDQAVAALRSSVAQEMMDAKLSAQAIAGASQCVYVCMCVCVCVCVCVCMCVCVCVYV